MIQCEEKRGFYPPLPLEKLQGVGTSALKCPFVLFSPFQKFLVFRGCNRMQKENFSNYHKKYDAFYQSKPWRRLRALKFAQACGLCERCKKKGLVRVGKEVHHIVPIEKDWEKRLDIDNLELLCPDCHNQGHGRESAMQKFNDFWEKLNAEKSGA